MRIILRVVAYATSSAILCAPAVWNGFPLLFDDIGGYVYPWWSGGLSNGRSTVYGGLLWFTADGRWWPAILLQALATVWTLDRLLHMAGERLLWPLPGLVAAFSVTSGVAFFVSQTMPDAWAAPAVLALHLLAWHGARLNGGERAGLMVIVAFAAASHMATLLVLVGLGAADAVAWLLRRRLGVGPDGLGTAAVALAAGLLLLPTTNALVTGRFALTPGGDAFVFGRLVESGVAGEILAAECSDRGWRLCAVREEIPQHADGFLWSPESPLHRLGGWDDPELRREMGQILVRALVTRPVRVLHVALASAAEQFVAVEVGDSMGPLGTWPDIRWTLERYAPALVARYESSRQARGEMIFATWSRWVVEPLTLFGAALLPLAAALLWRAGRRRYATLPAAVLIALLGNALVCGAFSGPHGRYQARLAWLAPLVLVLSLREWRTRADQDARRLSVSAMRGAK